MSKDVTYIQLRNGEVAETKDLVKDLVLMDCDKDGQVIGIEIICPIAIVISNLDDYGYTLTPRKEDGEPEDTVDNAPPEDSQD